MNQNIYDEELFFTDYGRLMRSKMGLKGAYEWPAFRVLLPDFKNKTVLDLGPGYGWHCIYAQQNGAKKMCWE